MCTCRFMISIAIDFIPTGDGGGDDDDDKRDGRKTITTETRRPC